MPTPPERIPPPLAAEVLARLKQSADRSVDPAGERHVLARLRYLEEELVPTLLTARERIAADFEDLAHEQERAAHEREGMLAALATAGWEAASGDPAAFVTRLARERDRLRDELGHGRQERAERPPAPSPGPTIQRRKRR